ncbi:MAG TPA: hypothetical protein VHD83_20670 [Puia sp.]|nr:hypothetical protein [Puia sp.]
MKLPFTPLFLCCLLGSPGDLRSQSSADQNQPPVYTSMIHVSTDNGNFKGRMIEMTDSSISIMLIKERTRMDIDARLIYTIKVKKRFFRSVLLDFSFGIGVTTALIVGYYWREGFWNPDYPPFGQALLGGLAVGGGGGLLYGMGESTFFKVRIPVNKSLEMFRLHRRRLLKFWLGNE